MDEQHPDLSEEEDEDLLEQELFTPGQLIVFFALAVPTSTAIQALGFGWNATVGCLTISALVAAFGPHLLRYGREHLRSRSHGPSGWHRLFLPLPIPLELTVEAEETQTATRIEVATSSGARLREAPDEEREEPATPVMAPAWVVPLFPYSSCPPSPPPVRQHDPEPSLPEQLAIHQLSQVRAPSAGASPRPGVGPARRDEEDWVLLDLGEGLQIHPDALLGSRMLVAGLPGTGKTNTMRRLIEQCGSPTIGLPFLLIDTDGEYVTLLPYLANAVVAGRFNRLDLPAMQFEEVTEEDARIFGKRLLAEHQQVIFDVKSYMDSRGEPDENQAVLVFMDIIRGMRAWQEARPVHERIPSMIFLEEAQVWLPQKAQGLLAPQTRKDVLSLFSRNARDGRRRGIGVCLIAHRIAGINKDVLLCEWMILHRPQATDLKRYMELVPTVPKERFQRLRQGQAVVVSPSGIRDILFHKARSHDNGATPGLAQLRSHEEQRTLASIRVDQQSAAVESRPMTQHVRVASSDEGAGASSSATANLTPEQQQALSAWRAGHNSVRKLERYLGIPYEDARVLRLHLLKRGLIHDESKQGVQ